MSIAPPALGVLEILRCERAPGESLYETARRVITMQALAEAGGVQQDAARICHCTMRTMNYNCRDLRLRPKDKKKCG